MGWNIGINLEIFWLNDVDTRSVGAGKYKSCRLAASNIGFVRNHAGGLRLLRLEVKPIHSPDRLAQTTIQREKQRPGW
jgi:hypothetical protein